MMCSISSIAIKICIKKKNQILLSCAQMKLENFIYWEY